MLKKSLFMITASYCLISTSTAMAEDKPAFPVGKIRQLSADYVSPRGEGSAKEIAIKDFGDFLNPRLEVENYNGILMFTVQNETFELDLSSLPIKDADKIDLSNLNFTNNDSLFNLDAGYLTAAGEGFNTKISGPSLECQKQEREGDEIEQLLQNCFNFMNLSVNGAHFKSDERQFYNLTNEYETLGSAVEIDELKLNFRGGKFSGRLKGNISKGTTVKFEGHGAYDVDNKILNIRIDKAKAGLFNVRRTIFNELEKMESNTIEVDEPNIYIIMRD